MTFSATPFRVVRIRTHRRPRGKRHALLAACCAVALLSSVDARAALAAGEPLAVPAFEELAVRPVNLKPELTGVHPRVFFTAATRSGT